MKITRRLLVSLMRNSLKSLSVNHLGTIQKMINAGMLMGVFEDAVDEALESKIADRWQQEQENGAQNDR